MAEYKRNQVEEAISGALGEQTDAPSSGLCNRIKRLLDADRNLPRTSLPKTPKPTNYAFYSSDFPGKGAEVLFSGYEAFALFIGLQMLNHNWPQQFAVETLRRFRSVLERHHRKILNLKPQELFDQVLAHRKPGDLATNSRSPLFLLIWSDQKQANDPAPSAGVFDQREAFEVVMAKVGRSSTWIELTEPTRLLADQLSSSRPRKRGRS